jgi:hypothetical protein
MRKLVLVAVVLVAAVGLLAGPAIAQADDQNCSDFPSQAAAQQHLRADPSDPDGLDADPGPADGNDQAGGDGIACESNPGPFDRAPVFADTSAPPTTGPGTSEQGLPFTGPSDRLLPLGGLLLAGGAGCWARPGIAPATAHAEASSGTGGQRRSPVSCPGARPNGEPRREERGSRLSSPCCWSAASRGPTSTRRDGGPRAAIHRACVLVNDANADPRWEAVRADARQALAAFDPLDNPAG